MTIKPRFSLRMLLALMLLASIPLAWWVNSAMRQQRAVEAIQKGGGEGYYDTRSFTPLTMVQADKTPRRRPFGCSTWEVENPPVPQ